MRPQKGARYNLKRILLAAIIIISIAFPLTATVPVHAITPVTQHKAVIISPLEMYVPMTYSYRIQALLTNAGYQLTYVTNTAVTIDFLLNHLNDYEVVIWRSNVYEWAHQMYWYVGEINNPTTAQKYASDFAAGNLDNHNGILGMSVAFIHEHFTAGLLTNVKLTMLISSESEQFAYIILNAGAKAVIYSYGYFSLTWGNMDYVTEQLTEYLTLGQSVGNATSHTVLPYQTMQPRDELDTVFYPQLWYMGDATLTIR